MYYNKYIKYILKINEIMKKQIYRRQTRCKSTFWTKRTEKLYQEWKKVLEEAFEAKI